MCSKKKKESTLNSYQVISHLEIHDWQAQFKRNTEEDHRELVGFLVDIQNSHDITNDALQVRGTPLCVLYFAKKLSSW
jgi:hypothetical protein